MEYPGYSIYPGEATEDEMCRDSLHVYSFVTEILGFDPRKVYLMGRSIGTGVCCFLASQKPVGMVVLISAFTSIKEVARYKYTSLLSGLVRERFNNVERIRNFKGPCLLIHGKQDDLVPVEQSQELFSRIV